MDLTKKIKQLIYKKKSNLCVSLDFNNTKDIIDTIELIKDNIVMVKLHCDIICDFNIDFIEKLTFLCSENDILILEDRKFADIGNTFINQFTKGVFKINTWCNLITMHSLIGDGPIKQFNEIKNNRQGILLIAEMSNKNNLLDSNYKQKTLNLAISNKNSVTGFICQKKIDKDDFIYCIPGVNRKVKGDNKDQKYITPEQAINNGADIIIVGRGIISSTDMLNESLIYKNICWDLYKNKNKNKN